MISAFTNIFKIPELRQRIFFTLLMIVVVRIGASITLPGVNAAVIQQWFAKVTSPDATDRGAAAVQAMLSVFSGGALQNCAVFALGIMPYISASIMMQLLTAVVPKLSKLAREDGGRQKINQYTRFGTIALCLLQGYLLALSLENPAQARFLFSGIASVVEESGMALVYSPGLGFRLLVVLTITAGTMFLMWLGDQITERGIGNGISIIITINILSGLPGALVQAWQTFIGGGGRGNTMSPAFLVLLVGLLLIVIAGVIAITQAQRRIAIQYAKRVVGRKVYGGQTTYMPLKVNYAGVMPIIFAQALLLFPSQIISTLFKSDAAYRFAMALTRGWPYYAVSATLIFFFSYFWVATMFQPTQIAEDLKKNGGYIPGVRPGKPTAEFLDFTMSRLTFAGAIFLTVIATLPQLISQALRVPPATSQFFGGTSLLIMVGVVLDTMRQIETHLLQRHYDGFLRKGRLRGRFQRGAGAAVQGKVASQNTMLWLYVLVAVLVITGIAIFLGRQ